MQSGCQLPDRERFVIIHTVVRYCSVAVGKMEDLMVERDPKRFRLPTSGRNRPVGRGIG